MSNFTVHIGTRDTYGGKPYPFGIHNEDARQHVYVIGKTGSGKTTLLKNLIIQHIEAGHGVGVIDPHGDLAEELLHHIPSQRTDDLCYFNPSDLEFPVAFNPLFNVPPDEKHLVASGIISSFKSLWRDSWGPRMEYILYQALAAMLDCQNVSLLGVYRMLHDDDYRAWVVRQVKDPFVKSFWQDEFAAYDERFRREAIAPIQNKLGQFLLNPPIRHILGQVKSKVSFPFMMDHERIFIANLSKGRLGHEPANLLGSLLVSQFQHAAMSRAKMPEAERKDFFLFIDEFQNFSTDSFAAILAEARKYRLCLTLSHQYIDQLPIPIRQAVFGNVGTLIAFRVGYSDAHALEHEFGKEFTAAQFVDQHRFETFVRLMQHGANMVPFKGTAAPPLEGKPSANIANLIEVSRRKFAIKQEIIKNRLERHTLPLDSKSNPTTLLSP